MAFCAGADDLCECFCNVLLCLHMTSNVLPYVVAICLIKSSCVRLVANRCLLAALISCVEVTVTVCSTVRTDAAFKLFVWLLNR